MSIELVSLATMSVVLRAPLMLDGTPVGSRWIFEVESGVIEGERINAKMKGEPRCYPSLRRWHCALGEK
ncbi:MAG: hypothetical protein ABWZ15_12995, partial [Acidimicrobiia bacterium]